MKTVYGAFGSIGSELEFVNGMLYKTTENEGPSIRGFDSYSEAVKAAEDRRHKTDDVFQSVGFEWVYSV